MKREKDDEIFYVSIRFVHFGFMTFDKMTSKGTEQMTNEGRKYGKFGEISHSFR